MSPDLSPPGRPALPSQGHHLATLSHEGRFWDVYLEISGDTRYAEAGRALLCFSPADRNDGESAVRTTTIIVEHSPQEAIARARTLETHHLVGLLRSCLPE
jgi:hypothetical protein